MAKNDNKKGGRLTTQEKYIIQGMRHEGKQVDEIASFVNRSESCVQNYLDGELNRIHEQVAKNQLNATGIPKLTAKDLIINTTDNGKKGTVAIMTGAASQRGDEVKKSMKGRANRVLGGNVVRLSDGKTIEHGDVVVETNSGELSKGEISIIVEMLQKNKTVKQIASSLKRNENDIAKVVNQLI